MKKTTTLLFFLISCCAFGQFNPLQTQYANNPMTVNPASAGEIGYMSATISARKQWLGFDGAPETFVFSIHTPVKKLQHNAGLIAAQDNLGVIHRTELSFVYAYRIITPKISYAAGIAPGIELFRNNWSEISTNTSGDAAFMNNEQYVRFNVGYGVYLNSKRFFIGVSNRAVYGKSFTVSEQPIQVFGGLRFGNAERVQFTISSLYRVISNGYSQIDMNANCQLRNKFGFGLGYRYRESLIAMAGVKLNDQLRVGYAYDYSISPLRNYSGGSHEILLRYDFGYTVERSNPRLR
jgi:type IX secretion system PorP/SprF family membrane protein